MQRVFGVLASLLVLALAAQFFLAAAGAFDTAPNDVSFQPHRVLGYGIILLAALSTIMAALARLPARLIWLTGLVTGLAVGQILIRVAADAFSNSDGTATTAGTLIFGVHAINGLAIVMVAGIVARRALALWRRDMVDRRAARGNEQDAAETAQPMS